MNPVERAIRAVDATQRRFTPTAFVFGVIKKYGDDNGGVLVSNLAYSAFVSLFPLLLILVTILGLIASVDPSFRESAVKNAVANQIPLLGQTLTSNVDALQRSSTIGLIVGLARPDLRGHRPGPGRAVHDGAGVEPARAGQARIRPAARAGGAVPCLLGGGVIVTTGLASLSTYLQHTTGFWLDLLIYVVTAAFGAGMYLGAFRALTPKGVPTRSLLPGAITGGILWTVLQVLGTWLVHHFLHSNSVYGVFATVLGLLAWIYLATEITVYSAEINVVLARRLWPRAIVQPPLTEADRASMALQALQNQRRPEQHIEVTFDDRPSGAEVPDRTPRTPEEVTPPADARRLPRTPPHPSRPGTRAARASRTRAQRARAQRARAQRTRQAQRARQTRQARQARRVQRATGRSEAASSRSCAQVALPVTTRVNPAALVRYIDRWPRAGAELRRQVCPPTSAGARAVPSLVIRRMNAAALALLSSRAASAPSGIMKPSCQVTVPGPLAPPTVRPELTGCQEAGRPAGATAGYGARRASRARSPA